MRFLALACDYDGTLATRGVIDETTAQALHRCRESGRKLVLVTGRELPELVALCPQLELFDRVVAENGALLYRPATRATIPLGPPPDAQFVDALRRAGVTRLSIGQVIVATWEPHETTVLNVIRDLGLELQVIFNKGAVMVLPTGINKATGLQAALKEMGLSPHNVVAVGDAENDHALLNSCEAGVAVFNAVAMLKSHADLVTVADHGAGVTELINLLIASDLADLEAKLVRHHLLVGHDEHGNEVRIGPYRRNVLICGSSGGGKSTIASALIERLIDNAYQVCIIDPDGDYADLPGTVSIGTSQQAPAVDEVMKLLESANEHVVVNLLALFHQDRPTFFLTLLSRLQEYRARRGRPHWIIVDEAHHVWPTQWKPDSLAASQHLDRTLFITLEPHRLPPAVLATVDLVLAVGTAVRSELEQFAAAAGAAVPLGADIQPERGTALMWNLKDGRQVAAVKIEPARSRRRRHQRKYAVGELEPQQSFYFRGPDGKLNLRAQNLSLFLQLAAGVDDDTWMHHLRAGDYSRWFNDQIKDPELAAQANAIERADGVDAVSSRQQIRQLVESQYILSSDSSSSTAVATPRSPSNP